MFLRHIMNNSIINNVNRTLLFNIVIPDTFTELLIEAFFFNIVVVPDTFNVQ
jgi:hypothetical protein